MSTPVLLAWSGGKDSVLALERLREQPETWSVVALVSHLVEGDRTLAMHGVPETLVAAQAASLGLPLETVLLPAMPSNREYEARLEAALAPWQARGVRHVAYGDLFLADIRDYRDAWLTKLGLTGVYPLWGADTRALADAFVRDHRAVAVCVDTTRLDASFAGRNVDAAFLRDLPGDTDPCGENGEFHTFVHEGPGFAFRVPLRVAGTESEGRFVRATLAAGEMEACARCGAPFTCGVRDRSAPCWCVSLPPVADPDPALGCACPRCLAAMVR